MMNKQVKIHVLIAYISVLFLVPSSCVFDSFSSFEPVESTMNSDRDGDGILDEQDQCPDEFGPLSNNGCPEVVAPVDNCPDDPNKTEPGDCGCGVPDIDSDMDGVLDCSDNCPDDPNKTEPGECGCGVPDTDSDMDGVFDCDDACPDDFGLASRNGCPEANAVADDGFILIPGGTFQMGDQFNEGNANELPVHTVQLSDFMMSPTVVTNTEMAAFLNFAGNPWVDGEQWYDIGSSRAQVEETDGLFYAEPGYEEHPAVHVSWYLAISFCNWKSKLAGLDTVYTIDGTNITPDWSANGYRLPTEAEWEYAAREGGRKVRFGNGEDIAREAQMNFDARQPFPYSERGGRRFETIPVDALEPNSLGLYHMSGNVLVFCWDIFGSTYYSESENSTDPKGPETGVWRVMRGGTWGAYADNCRASKRYDTDPTNKYNTGILLVRKSD